MTSATPAVVDGTAVRVVVRCRRGDVNAHPGDMVGRHRQARRREIDTLQGILTAPQTSSIEGEQAAPRTDNSAVHIDANVPLG